MSHGTGWTSCQLKCFHDSERGQPHTEDGTRPRSAGAGGKPPPISSAKRGSSLAMIWSNVAVLIILGM